MDFSSIADVLPALLVTEADIIIKFYGSSNKCFEILFFSASIPCIMATEIPMKFSDYIIIWLKELYYQ